MLILKHAMTPCALYNITSVRYKAPKLSIGQTHLKPNTLPTLLTKEKEIKHKNQHFEKMAHDHSRLEKRLQTVAIPAC